MVRLIDKSAGVVVHRKHETRRGGGSWCVIVMEELAKAVGIILLAGLRKVK